MARKRPKSHRRGPPREGVSGSPIASVNGWTILAHPLFIAQMEKLVAAAEREPRGKTAGPNTKLLGHLLDLAFDKIPQNPSGSQYRQGKTLGDTHKHWARAKTGNGRYRLFFRYSTSARAILYAWVNDDQSLRSYGRRDDAYSVFARMLEEGNPPDDWDALVRDASKPSVSTTFRRLAARVTRRSSES